MTPQKQLFRHDPAQGLYGDCYRTAIACLLDLPVEEVPHEHAEVAAASDFACRRWLLEQGLMIVTVNVDQTMTQQEILDALAARYPGVNCMLCGESPRGDCDHVVIVRDGQVVWDPSPDGRGLAGPSKTSGFWSCEFIARRT